MRTAQRLLPALVFGLGLGLGVFQPRLAAADTRLSGDQFNLLRDRLRQSGLFKVRLQAALLLGAAGGPEAVPVLVSTLQADDSDAVRAAAALALGETLDARAVEPLVGALTDAVPLVRGQAQKALTQLAQGLPDGPLKLWSALAQAPGTAQQQGIGVLASLGTAGVQGLCAAAVAAPESLRNEARAALARMPPEQLDAGLRETLRLRDVDASALAAAMLGDRGQTAALTALADATLDPLQPAEVRAEARSALVRLSSVINPSAERARFASDDPNERMRAVTILAVRGGPEAEDLTLRALGDPNQLVAATGAQAAADLGVVRALPAIRKLLQHEESTPILGVLQIAERRLTRKRAADETRTPQ